jgi:malate dehydrogenase (quinone)
MKTPQSAILIGAGIMSATLATLLKRLNPKIEITIFEALDKVAEESSGAMNNAGTGHSGYCELNYTPLKNGAVDISKAVDVAQKFNLSKEFWATLVQEGHLPEPRQFINPCPHHSLVWGDKNVDFLRRRYETMKQNPWFSAMEYTEDSKVLAQWFPLAMQGRTILEPMAGTRMNLGTDIDFGHLTNALMTPLLQQGVKIHCGFWVKDLQKTKAGWRVLTIRKKDQALRVKTADFVFVGAGGGALLLLEKSGIPEMTQYGGFPVGGEWLVCNNPEVIKGHQAKVYGQTPVGAPPMSVPHLDTRIIDGKPELLFGPFAVFSTKFLKHGSSFDLFKSLQLPTIFFMSQAGLKNLDLTTYLMQQATLTKMDKIKVLQSFYPEAKAEDWIEQRAGQRVQVIKKIPGQGGVLEFGTEVVTDQAGDLAALLGASPGASTSVEVMVQVLKKCFPETYQGEWKEKLQEWMPSLDQDLTAAQIQESIEKTSTILGLK